MIKKFETDDSGIVGSKDRSIHLDDACTLANVQRLNDGLVVDANGGGVEKDDNFSLEAHNSNRFGVGADEYHASADVGSFDLFQSKASRLARRDPFNILAARVNAADAGGTKNAISIGSQEHFGFEVDGSRDNGASDNSPNTSHEIGLIDQQLSVFVIFETPLNARREQVEKQLEEFDAFTSDA